MADPLTLAVGGLRAPSSSSTSRSSRRPATETRLDAAARCLQEFLLEPAALPSRRRSPGFVRAVERVRAELIPIATTAGLVDSYGREALRNDVIETAYAIRWLELIGGTVEPPWAVLAGA